MHMHEGLFMSATFVLGSVAATLREVTKPGGPAHDWPLLITGHSPGVGGDVGLALLLRDNHKIAPHIAWVRCLGLATPSVVDPETATWSVREGLGSG
jgi:hypothetical protein